MEVIFPQHWSRAMIELSVLTTPGSLFLPGYMGSLPSLHEVMLEKEVVLLEKGESSMQT